MPKRRSPATRSALAATLALGLVLGSPVIAGATDNEPTEITFAIINDFHGRIDDNTVKWAGTIEQIRAEAGEERTLLVSAGDNFGNSLYASSVQGETPTVEVLNALELDASAVGNNELFIGYDKFQGLAKEAQFPFLAANMVNGATGEVETGAYSIEEIDGVRVAIIGVVTPETQVQFPEGDPKFLATVETLNRTAEEIEQRGLADVTVAVIHDGGGFNSPPASLDDELAQGGVLANLMTQTTPLVDALFTGHTHNQYVYEAPMPGNPDRTRPVIQTGSFGQMVGKVTLRYDRAAGGVTSSSAELIPRSATPDAELVAQYPRVAAVEAIAEEALTYAELMGNAPAGKATAPITTAFSGGDYVDGRYAGGLTGQRTLESSLGTLVANMFRDVQRDQAVPPQFGLTIPNFIRSDLTPDAAGNVPVKQLIETFGIRDTITSADITGAQLKRLLEQQWQRNAEGEAKGFIQLGISDNLTYTYDDTRREGDRITSITLDGQAVDAQTSYRVGLTGGILIGLVNFHEGIALTQVQDSGLVDVEGFQQYFAELSAGAPVAPSFVKHGVKIIEAAGSVSLLDGEVIDDLVERPNTGTATLAPGSRVEFDVSMLNLTSIGAPANTTLNVSLNDLELDPAVIIDGAARVSFDIPESLAEQDVVLRISAEPSGTVASRYFTVANDDSGGSTPKPEPDGDPDPDPGPQRDPDPSGEREEPGAAGRSVEAGGLAATGADPRSLILWGGAVLGAGSAFLLARRLRTVTGRSEG